MGPDGYDALAIETPDGKPRRLGAAGVAHILGRLDADGIAAELAGAAAGSLAHGLAAQPASPNELKPGEEKCELVPGEHIPRLVFPWLGG
jgi:hypothetical protein